MWLSNLLETLVTELGGDLVKFAPELILCVAIVVMLLLRLFRGLNRVHMGSVALALTLVAFLYTLQIQWGTPWAPIWGGPRSQELFKGLLAYDNFTIFVRLFLFVFTVLIIWLSLLTGIPDREDSADFYSLLLGAVVGMCLMASANHLLMVFIGVEMASLPSFALAGFLKGKRQSSEAALKYVVYGGGASGIMLYGISLLSGKFGTGYMPDLAVGYTGLLKEGGSGWDLVLLLGTIFVLVGIAFKLAAVPFHFWCPDVFEGAAAEVAAFLSVASKGAALALLARFTLVLSGATWNLPSQPALFQMAQYLGPPLALAAAVTATFGNLAAYLQTNLKRLLAYSTIAHAGYMMMALATFTQEGVSAVLFYLVAYLFMNLGAFAIVAFLRNQTGSEELSSYHGLIQRSPLMVVTFGFFLFSLVGVPPLVGFAAKFQIFLALFHAGRDYLHMPSTLASLYTPSDLASLHFPPAERFHFLGYTMYALVVIAGINTVISLVYYVNVLRVMALDKPTELVEGKKPAPRLAVPRSSAFYATLVAGIVLVLGILWGPLAENSDRGGHPFKVAPTARGEKKARAGT
jgi:NADH-quinone oxidoreductase subunit N